MIQGRHDLLKSFYFDVLKCAVDPRKEENWGKGAGTLWANCGINQFHLPQEAQAQVFAGRIVLEYSDLAEVAARCDAALCSTPYRTGGALSNTKFRCEKLQGGALEVTCPWGNTFELRQGGAADPRGVQPGPVSEPLGMPELQVHVPAGGNLAGIARFYETLIGAHVETRPGEVHVKCGGGLQTLVFCEQAPGVAVEHSDYHVSMYVNDFPSMFKRMEEQSLVFVNPRFKRKAATLDEAVEQCMFRVKDIIDPESPQDGAIIVLEHEIRSPVKQDGSKYKSCPLEGVVPVSNAPDNF